MVLAILSGLLTGITFIFPQISFLGFFSVIPFLYTVKNNKSCEYELFIFHASA